MKTTKAIIADSFSGFWSTLDRGIARPHARELATDPELVRLVETGEHLSGPGPSEAFTARYREIVGSEPRPDDYSVRALKVVEVTGRFYIVEHDGRERVQRFSDIEWLGEDEGGEP